MNKCTYGSDAIIGQRCGRPAVVSFRGSDEQTYHECAEHYVPIPVIDMRRRVGGMVQIRRYGKIYFGEIIKLTPTKYHVRFRYDNGVERTVVED
jgi:hypothetical protein